MAEYIEREAARGLLENALKDDWETDYALDRLSEIPAADVRPVVQREDVIQALSKYFSIGDSDTYELTRVKEAFYVGTMTLEDFEEWGEDNISDLCDYLMKELFCPNCGADMRQSEVENV